MKFGLALPHYDFSLPGKARTEWEDLLDITLEAESLGFDSAWISDHIAFDVAKYGGPPEERETFEWATALGALAAATESIRLGILVACTPLRSAPITAKTAATIDQISSGRLELGLGAGWYERDFELASIPFPPPGERVEALVRTAGEIRRLLDGSGPRLEPGPIQRPSPPITFGGKGGRGILEAVALAADKWNLAWATTPKRYSVLLQGLERACEAHGRDPSSLGRSIGLTTLVGYDERDLARRFMAMEEATWPLPPNSLTELRSERLAGTPDAVIERIAAYAELGVEEVICCFGPAPFMLTSRENLQTFAELIITGSRHL